MATSISIDFGRVIAAGQELQEFAKEYDSVYQHLMETVSSMSVAWSGVDNQRYVAGIRSCDPDYTAISKALRSYAELLIECGETYRRVQATLANSAAGVGGGTISAAVVTDSLATVCCNGIPLPPVLAITPSISQGELKISSTQVTKSAEEIRQCGKKMNEILSRTMEVIQKVRVAWQSDAAESVQAAFTKITPKFDGIRNLTDKYAEFLDEVVRVYTQLENTVSSNVGIFQ